MNNNKLENGAPSAEPNSPNPVPPNAPAVNPAPNPVGANPNPTNQPAAELPDWKREQYLMNELVRYHFGTHIHPFLLQGLVRFAVDHQVAQSGLRYVQDEAEGLALVGTDGNRVALRPFLTEVLTQYHFLADDTQPFGKPKLNPSLPNNTLPNNLLQNNSMPNSQLPNNSTPVRNGLPPSLQAAPLPTSPKSDLAPPAFWETLAASQQDLKA